MSEMKDRGIDPAFKPCVFTIAGSDKSPFLCIFEKNE